MKKLNAKSAKILNALLSLGTTRIDNTEGLYMPVCVEVVCTVSGYRLVSVAHYGLQNGDMMCDPEMTFWIDPTNQEVTPASFRNDYLGLYRETVVMREGELQLLDALLQSDQMSFANGWFSNIAEQQGLLF